MFQLAPTLPTPTAIQLSRNNSVIVSETPIAAIAINGRSLELSVAGDLEPGQFRLTTTGAEVNPFEETKSNFIATYQVATDQATTRAVPLPTLLANLGNARPKITTNQVAGDHPSMSVVFVDCLDRLPVYEDFCNGEVEVTFDGVGYRLASRTILPDPPNNQLTATLNFTGHWDSYGTDQSKLDLPIRLSEFNDCHNQQNTISLSRLASKVGVSYLGRAINIRHNQTDSEATATVREILEARAAYVGGVPYYSNPNAVEIRQWKPRIHVLTETNRVEKTPFNYQGQNLKHRGVELAQIYRNTEIRLDLAEANRETDEIQSNWSHKNCISFTDLQSPDEPIRDSEGGISAYRRPTADTLRNPSNAYDTGGFTKQITNNQTREGKPIRDRVWTWGWVFTSLDYYRIVQNTDSALLEQNDFYRVEFAPRRTGIASFWRQVDYRETFIFHGISPLFSI